MKKYELALVVSAKLEDDARADVVEKAKGYVTRYDGVISQVEEWGRRRLAYEIAHQREGYYFFIHFEAEPEAPAQIESHVRIMDGILRFLIVLQEGDDVIIPAPEAAPAEEAVAAAETVEEAAEAAAETVEEAAEAAEEAAEAVEESAEEAPASEE